MVSGRAGSPNAEEVVVRTRDGRTFQYWHVLPQVRTGELGDCVQDRSGDGDPAPGTPPPDGDPRHVRCEPAGPRAPRAVPQYEPPQVVALDAVGSDGVLLDPTQVAGPFELVVQAQDQTPLPVPPPWENLPVTPATVKWRLTRAGVGVLVPWTFAADFAVTIPPSRDYWRVYADGTHQNFVGRTQPQLPGTFRFRLTRPGTSLAPGRYTVAVQVSTSDGSRTTDQLSFRVVPGGAPL